jgi:hypothetical protein
MESREGRSIIASAFSRVPTEESAHKGNALVPRASRREISVFATPQPMLEVRTSRAWRGMS